MLLYPSYSIGVFATTRKRDDGIEADFYYGNLVTPTCHLRDEESETLKRSFF